VFPDVVRVDAAPARALASRFMRVVVPRALPQVGRVVVEGAAKGLRFWPALGVFIDVEQLSLQAALLGETGPGVEHWASGDEDMSPIQERPCFEVMDPEYDGGPTRW
jgi:hypothetical protein